MVEDGGGVDGGGGEGFPSFTCSFGSHRPGGEEGGAGGGGGEDEVGAGGGGGRVCGNSGLFAVTSVSPIDYPALEADFLFEVIPPRDGGSGVPLEESIDASHQEGREFCLCIFHVEEEKREAGETTASGRAGAEGEREREGDREVISADATRREDSRGGGREEAEEGRGSKPTVQAGARSG